MNNFYYGENLADVGIDEADYRCVDATHIAWNSPCLPAWADEMNSNFLDEGEVVLVDTGCQSGIHYRYAQRFVRA